MPLSAESNTPDAQNSRDYTPSYAFCQSLFEIFLNEF